MDSTPASPTPLASPPSDPPPSVPAPLTEPAPSAQSAPSAPARRLPWAALGVEAFAVFLSVLSGFALTAWLDTRHEAGLRRQALENFREEMALNRGQVAERLPYHASVQDGFARVVDGPLPPTFAEVARQTGYRGPRIVFFQTTALRTADATGALALLDYETARAVVSAYTLQEAIEESQRAVLNAGLSPDMFTPTNIPGTSAALLTYFGVIVELETELLGTYDAVLAHLDGQIGPRPDSSRVRS